MSQGSADATTLDLVWVLPRPLHPLDTGGKIRSWNILRRLAARHPLTVLALAGDPSELRPLRDPGARVEAFAWSEAAKGSPGFLADVAFHLFSPLPFVVAKYRSPALARRVRELAAAGRADAVVADFLHVTVNVPPVPTAARVLFEHNVEAQVRRRHIGLARSPFARAYLWWEWRRLAAYERRVCRGFDAVVAVSQEDAALLRGEFGARAASAVPTGVDADYFTPEGERLEPGWDLVFTGSMDWAPNAEGVDWFVGEVLPRIRRRRPEARVVVVGRNPPPALCRRCEAAGGMTVTGRVADVRPYVRAARVYVVPIRFGGGTRIKIFEAMAMGCPVVSTRLGAEGLPVSDGAHLRVADDPAGFAAAVLGLLEDRAAARALAATARALVLREHGWDRVTDSFEAALRRAVAGRTRRGGEG